MAASAVHARSRYRVGEKVTSIISQRHEYVTTLSGKVSTTPQCHMIPTSHRDMD